MTRVGDIEIELVFRIAVRGRTSDLVRLLQAMNKAEAVVIATVEKHASLEEQGHKDVTITAGGFSG